MMIALIWTQGHGQRLDVYGMLKLRTKTYSFAHLIQYGWEAARESL